MGSSKPGGFIDVSRNQQGVILGKLQNLIMPKKVMTQPAVSPQCNCACQCDCECNCACQCDCECNCACQCDCDCNCTCFCSCPS